MKNRLALLLAAAALAFLLAGCRGDKDRGINKDKDREVPAATGS